MDVCALCRKAPLKCPGRGGTLRPLLPAIGNARARSRHNHLKSPVATHANFYCSSPASRRHLLTGLMSSFAVLGTGILGARSAVAAPKVADYVSLLLPPAPTPVKFPRKGLDQAFAVLLMRSAYEAVDALDFIPMDEFQKKFWKLRQNETEAYTQQYSPLRARQGDLTDPLYFDFISFAQFATIAQAMGNGQQVFQEYCAECEEQGQYRLVRRSPDLADNAQLPASFFRKTGEMIYDGLLNGFREQEFGAPPPCPPGASQQQLMQSIQKLLNIMADHGYAIKATVMTAEPVAAGQSGQGQFKISVQGPANLWGLTALQYRRSSVLNSFDAMVVDAYLRASGRTAQHSMTISDVGLQEDWQLL